MRILCDLHHGDLYRSLLMLFEGRLGHQVYRPIGMEWFDEGYWRYLFPARETAQQYLDARTYPEWPGVRLEIAKLPGSVDLLLSSTPPMFYAFERFRVEHAPKAKHLWQSGNQWECMPEVRNFLNSTTVEPRHDCNHVRYHQEFSLRDYFPSDPPLTRKGTVANFMHYTTDRSAFAMLEREFPGFEFREYGAGNRDGQPADLARAMREIRYLWHPKAIEAYGYNVHYAAACGKPIICRRRMNQHQMCGAFLTPETSIDMDDYATPQALAEAIREFDAHYAESSAEMVRLFRKAVDFDKEEVAIRAFMEGLR